MLGAPLRGRYRDHGGDAFLARLSATLRDPQTWKDLQWLVVHSVVGLAFGCAAISLVAQVVGLATLPLWFWALPGGLDWWGLSGVWQVDTLWESLLVAPTRDPAGRDHDRAPARDGAWRGRPRHGIAGRTAPASPVAAAPGLPAEPAPRGIAIDGRALPLHVALAALAGFACSLIWGLTTRGYYWPVWVWLGLAISVALHALTLSALRAEGDAGPQLPRLRRPVRGDRGDLRRGLGARRRRLPVAGVADPRHVAGAGGARALRLPQPAAVGPRAGALRARRPAHAHAARGLDVQAAELRRIERDLHDGAQARLVALSMQLGRAEARLSDQPELGGLVRQARGEASAAIAELRDLARGIAPPVLVDRGLEAAVEALGRRVATDVTVDARIDRRPAPVIETAAYFVVAEALTNVAKHAGGARARVELHLERTRS